MTLHICRDFQSKHPSQANVSSQFYGVCLSAYFLRGVLGFTYIGSTSFPLESGSVTLGSGINSANINLGPGFERNVQLPSGSYVVSLADIDRVLALKSNLNPMLNSGLFRVASIDVPTNSFLITTSAWLDFPPAETGVSWRLFENEGLVTNNFSNASNGLPDPAYHGEGTSTTSRIILQSPHSTGWQVRICAECSRDVNNFNGGTIGSACSFAPGFGGNAAGDFAHGGQHLHQPQWWNLGTNFVAQQRTQNSVCGIAYSSTTNPGRYYMWGDDATGTCLIVVRQHGDFQAEALVAFGLPEDEEQPIPTSPIYRLFTFGNVITNAQVARQRILVKPGVVNNDPISMMGTAYGLSNQPITLIPSSWAFAQGQGFDLGLMNDATAGDDVYLGASTLWAWDLYAGTYDNILAGPANNSPAQFSVEPRRLGRFPIARRGRENFNDFSTSTDVARQFLHLQHGVFCPWSGSINP